MLDCDHGDRATVACVVSVVVVLLGSTLRRLPIRANSALGEKVTHAPTCSGPTVLKILSKIDKQPPFDPNH